MIFENSYGCCGRSALRGFGAVMDVDDLYRGVVGAGNPDEMFLVVSQFLCGRNWAGNKDAALALLDSHISDFDPDLPDNFPAQWGLLAAARQSANTLLHPLAECQANPQTWFTQGKAFVDQIVNLGKQKVPALPPKVEAKSAGSPLMLLGLAAVGVAAVVLLGGKKS